MENTTPVYLLHGWRDDEDEDVEIDSPDQTNCDTGLSGRLPDLKISVLGVAGSNQRSRTSVDTLSEGAGQECESRASVEAVDSRPSTRSRGKACTSFGKSVKDTKDGGDTYKGSDEESSQPQGLLKGGKRLDARRFRNIFAAKLSEAKKLTTRETLSNGEGGADAGLLLGPVCSSSSHDVSCGVPSVKDDQTPQEGSSNEEPNDEVQPHHVQNNRMTLLDAKVKFKTFSRKRKNATHVGHTGNMLKNGSETTSGQVAESPDPMEKGENSYGHLKRVQKENTKDHYIPRPDSGKLSLGNNDKGIVEVLGHTHEKEMTKSIGKAADNTDYRNSSVEHLGNIVSDTDLKANETCQQIEKDQEKKMDANTSSSAAEQFQNEHGETRILPLTVISVPKHLSPLHDDSQELSGKSCELVVLLDSSGTDGDRSPKNSPKGNEGKVVPRENEAVDALKENKRDGVANENEGDTVLKENEADGVSKENERMSSLKEHEAKGATPSAAYRDVRTDGSLGSDLSRAVNEEPKSDVGSTLLLPDRQITLEPSCLLDDHDSVCNMCKKEGNLICCDGKVCKLTYHITCLDPPLTDVPPNDWYCPDCAYKRISLNMHSVSKGIESIWDVKEDNLQSTKCSEPHGHDGILEGAEENGNIQQDMAGKSGHCNALNQPPVTLVKYFVKYKGVAHAYNQWLPENQVLKEAPKLLQAFKKRLTQGKACKWDPEWARPSRIIGKRETMLSQASTSMSGGEIVNRFSKCLEWLVKWCHLGYESCTWEPEINGLLGDSKGHELIRAYELRSIQAKDRNERRNTHRIKKLGFSSFVDLSRLLGLEKGESLSPAQQDCVLKLCKFWEKGINGIIVAESFKERILTTVVFLRYLVDICEVVNPIFVIVPPASVGLWEATFQEWAPLVNVIFDGGNKEARQIIQRYEFYNENKQFMAQIVITNFDTLNLDVELIKEFSLEALVVDECQRLKGTRTNRSLCQINSVFRLLLLNESLKENVDDYHHLLSILSVTNGSSDGVAPQGIASLAKLKSTVGKHLVYESKQNIVENSNPKEFWVPVKLTGFQIEEYCKLLADRSDILTRGKRAGDIISSPHALLLKLRECCNHPYLVNRSFQESLTHLSPEELLEFGVQASGKLRYLDMILHKIKELGKRAIIITQLHLRSEKESQMEILDDYMRQRFGINSYERVDMGLMPSKKIAAVQRFNTKYSECFVFLLDKRACGPAIRLSFVNYIIIFDSDWNPSIDVQAVLKLGLHTQSQEWASIPIFRLYSPHTVEERALIFTRRMVDLENDCNKFTLTVCQRLLRWGVRRNFEVFDCISEAKDQSEGGEEKRFAAKSVGVLLGNGSSPVDTGDVCLKTTLCTRQLGQYNDGQCLYGENEEELQEEESLTAADFWTEIFRTRHLEPHDGLGRGLRARKKVKHCDGIPTPIIHANAQDPINDEDDNQRKRRRVADMPDAGLHTVNARMTLTSLLERERNFNSQGVAVNDTNARLDGGTMRATLVMDKDKTCTVENDNRSMTGSSMKVAKDKNSPACVDSRSNEAGSEPSCGGVRTEQQQLLLSIKPDLDKLCNALKFQADTAAHVEQLLFSIGSSFKLPKDKSLLHSLELSLCWLAAEQQHYAIDRAATLALAEACFGVQLDKIETVHAKLSERVKKKLVSSDQTSRHMQEQEKGLPQIAGPDATATGQQDQQGPSLQNLDRLDKTANLTRSQEPLHVHTVVSSAAPSCTINAQHRVASDTTGISSASPINTLNSQQAVSSDFVGVANDATQVSMMSKERWIKLQMHALTNAQQSQMTKLEAIKKSYVDKIKHHYDAACARLDTSRNRTEALQEERKAYEKTLNLLETTFKSIQDDMLKQQLGERDKASRLIALHAETGITETFLTALNLESVSLSEGHVHSLLPPVLKAAITSGGLTSLWSCATNRADTVSALEDTSRRNVSTPMDQHAQRFNISELAPATAATAIIQSHQTSSSNASEVLPQHHHYQLHPQRSIQPSQHPLQQRWSSSLSREQGQSSQVCTSETQHHNPAQAQVVQALPASHSEFSYGHADATRSHRVDGSEQALPFLSLAPSPTISRSSTPAMGSSSLPIVHGVAVPCSRIGPTTSGSSQAPMVSHGMPSRLSRPQASDPLVQELTRLRKEQDKIKSTHEAEKEKLKAQFMKELEALSRKYDNILKEEDAKYAQRAAILEANIKKVEMNRRLAEVFRLKTAHETPSASLGFSSVPAQVGVSHQQQMPVANARVPSVQGSFLSDQSRYITLQSTRVGSPGMQSSLDRLEVRPNSSGLPSVVPPLVAPVATRSTLHSSVERGTLMESYPTRPTAQLESGLFQTSPRVFVPPVTALNANMLSGVPITSAYLQNPQHTNPVFGSCSIVEPVGNLSPIGINTMPSVVSIGMSANILSPRRGLVSVPIVSSDVNATSGTQFSRSVTPLMQPAVHEQSQALPMFSPSLEERSADIIYLSDDD